MSLWSTTIKPDLQAHQTLLAAIDALDGALLGAAGITLVGAQARLDEGDAVDTLNIALGEYSATQVARNAATDTGNSSLHGEPTRVERYDDFNQYYVRFENWNDVVATTASMYSYVNDVSSVYYPTGINNAGELATDIAGTATLTNAYLNGIATSLMTTLAVDIQTAQDILQDGFDAISEQSQIEVEAGIALSGYTQLVSTGLTNVLALEPYYDNADAVTPGIKASSGYTLAKTQLQTNNGDVSLSLSQGKTVILTSLNTVAQIQALIPRFLS